MKQTFIVGMLALASLLSAQDDLKIESWVVPATVALGEEGVLRIRITPRAGVRISSHPEFMIRFAESEQFSFSKVFFTGSELNFPRIKDGDGVFLDLQKEAEFRFQVSEDAFIGKHTIKGDIVFTILTQEKWYVKTIQKFSTSFSTKRNPHPAKKGSLPKKNSEICLSALPYKSPSPRYQWMVSARAFSRSVGGVK